MSRCVFVALAFGALIAGAIGVAAAAPPANSVESRDATTASAASDTLSPAAPETPMTAEIRQARASFVADLRALSDLYRAAKTPAEVTAIQRRIAELKFDDELRMLDIQARHAREAGLTARADELQNIIAQLRAEGPDGSPAAALK